MYYLMTFNIDCYKIVNANKINYKTSLIYFHKKQWTRQCSF